MASPLLDIQGLSKAYGGVQALAEVSLDITVGEVHALVGENGAGKSTLIKILSGAVRPDGGTVRLLGSPLRFGSVRASEANGIAAIHQEFTGFTHLSAEDNIFVGREPRRLLGLMLDRPRMRRETRELLEGLGERIDQGRSIAELPVAQRQIVGIARALSHRCRLLIMDEPTASLSAREAETLFTLIRRLRTEGVSILYVSHRLEEVFLLADRVTVLRDGRRVDTLPAGELNRESLIRMMVGRELGDGVGGTGQSFLTRADGHSQGEARVQKDAPVPPGQSAIRNPPLDPARGPEPAEGQSAIGEVVLEVKGLTRKGAFRGIGFELRAGEILGLSGLVGAGRSEVARAIFGIDRPDGGTVLLNGRPLKPGSVRQAMRRGLALVPEDRQHLGLILPMSVSANLTLTMLRSLSRFGLTDARREEALVARQMAELDIRAPGPQAPAETLSGGNQQKLVLGKWLARSPRVLILDEPTRGVDVGAKAEVHKLIRRLAGAGMATLLISSELPEVLAMCDRILVMRAGEIAGELSRAEATQEKVLELALSAAPPPSRLFGAEGMA